MNKRLRHLLLVPFQLALGQRSTNGSSLGPSKTPGGQFGDSSWNGTSLRQWRACRGSERASGMLESVGWRLMGPSNTGRGPSLKGRAGLRSVMGSGHGRHRAQAGWRRSARDYTRRRQILDAKRGYDDGRVDRVLGARSPSADCRRYHQLPHRMRWLTQDPPDVEEAREAASRSVKDARRAGTSLDGSASRSRKAHHGSPLTSMKRFER
jgi:hypothetical protein